MDLTDSLLKQQKADESNRIAPFLSSAAKYASQGFDFNSVSEILQVEGCDVETSKKIALSVINELPFKYAEEMPPDSFVDVIDIIKDTIKSASREDLEGYFNKYADNEFKSIINRILIARDNNSDTLVSEVVQELEPLVDDLIVTNKALSLDEKFASTIDEKEKIEQKLFGVWPVHLVRERLAMDKGDLKVLKRAKVDPGISFI